jgi:hypothetical protein
MFNLQRTGAIEIEAGEDEKTIRRKITNAAQTQITQLAPDAHDACRTTATTRQPARVIVKVIVMVTAGQPTLPNMEA